VDVGLKPIAATREITFDAVSAVPVGDDGSAVNIVVLTIGSPEPELDAGFPYDRAIDARANNTGEHEASPDMRPHGGIRRIKGICTIPLRQWAPRSR